MRESSYHGLLVLDKPSGLTSRAATDRALGWFPRGTRLGHTGTLDPLATGVLVLCLGTATRLAEHVQRMAKTYRSTFLLGATSDTDDADGLVTPRRVEQPPDRRKVQEALASFIGEIDQVPPAYSAAKVAGRRAYNLARQGAEVALQSRRVRIDEIIVQAYEYPRLEVEVRCGKGTYIRSLARDLGERLGCGALVEVLRRTRVGLFTVDDSLTLDADAATARARLLPLATAVAELPRLTLTADGVRRLRQGQKVPLPEDAVPLHSLETAVFDPTGGLVAVARIDPERRLLLPDKVLAEAKTLDMDISDV
jgi:tRNA pseudouridine55 synthase